MKISRIKIGNFFLYRGSVSDRCVLASSKDISYVQLKELATDPCTTVRIRLAHRDDLPDDIVQILWRDKSLIVKNAILNNEKIKIPGDRPRRVGGNVKEEEFIKKRAQGV